MRQVDRVVVTELCQGRQMRWVIAWSFSETAPDVVRKGTFAIAVHEVSQTKTLTRSSGKSGPSKGALDHIVWQVKNKTSSEIASQAQTALSIFGYSHSSDTSGFHIQVS